MTLSVCFYFYKHRALILVNVFDVDSSEHSSSYPNELEKLVVLVTTELGWGTGISLTPTLVITCDHVVRKRQGLFQLG